ncbi:MAG TPA: hypothetical protein PKW56_08495 [Clostridiales bacterium]|nr:hypothetical protein [Clostridiales bacterium]
MNKYLILILLIISCALLAIQNPLNKNDLTELQLKGKVKSVEEINDCHEITIFNKFGNPVKKIFYNKDDAIHGYQIFSYDDKGNRISSEEYDSKENQVFKRIYYYNDKNELVKENWFKSDTLNGGWNYKYNEQGGLAEWNAFDQKSNIIQKIAEYEYNESGELIILNEYSGGKLSYVHKYTYDEKGNEIVHRMDFIHEKNRYATETKTFDISGNVIKIEYSDSKGLSSSSVINYDQNDNVVRQESYKSGEIIIVKNTNYEYDDHGNWVKMVTQANTAIRKIEYYE